MEKNTFFILDAYALIFRSYYAFINNPRYNSKGLNTSAIFGFLNTLDEILKKENPTHIAVCFDAPVPSFRKDIYPEYKANRDATPEDIKKSVPYIKSIISAFNIPIFEQAGFEADDLAGSLAKMFSKKDFKVLLMTSDKDYLQLIDENISVYKPRTKSNEVQIIGLNEFKEQFGLEKPEQFIEILALAGDTADNVPGISGVGEKTAMDLIQKYKSIEGIYQNIEKLTPKQKEKFLNGKEIVALSKKLVTIDTNIFLDTNEEHVKRKEPNSDELTKLFEELEFKKTSERVLKPQIQQQTLFDLPEKTEIQKTLKNIADVKPEYIMVETEFEFDELINSLKNSKEFVFDTETSSLDVHSCDIVGISFCIEKNKAYYLPFSKDRKEAQNTLKRFSEIFENENISKIGQNIKFDLSVLMSYGITVNGKLFDTMIAHSLLFPELKHNMDYLAETYLNYKTIHIDELIGKKGVFQLKMSDLKPEKIKDYACEDSDITFQLKNLFYPMLEESGMSNIFNNIEMPLINVLTKMEHFGVKIDTEFLKNYRNKIAEKLLEIEKEIYQKAGATFNISSTKQLGDILFKKLKISDKPKLTKTKQYATDETELLKYEGKHEIVKKILEFRSLSKLISTYIDALPELVNKKTGRIHTSYNQSITVTGRLSSNNPNLQNIPIKTQEGREIRKAFVPENEYIFIDADYSQVELRLMAHLSQDPNMLEAFQNGLDIHSQTASKIFNVPLNEVTKEMRYQAKTANFAMIYGSSSFGLSQNLNISISEAKKLIENYFATYPKVKEYMDKMIKLARDKEFVTTLFCRKRYLKDINSQNSLIRSNAEHNAINTPIQGSAADIIKLAMINIDKKITEGNLKSKLLLQVHDELLFECQINEKEELMKLIKYEMENAVNLSVPLLVDISFGNSWSEAH